MSIKHKLCHVLKKARDFTKSQENARWVNQSGDFDSQRENHFMSCKDIRKIIQQAIHPVHGLVWVDNSTIWLGQTQIHDGKIELRTRNKLGDFDNGIESVHWSACKSLCDVCFLCVVHSQCVSVWRVEGREPQLRFKKIRQIDGQAVSQGCLWNPTQEVLCVINKQQCILSYNHTEERGILVLPEVKSVKVKCGTWSSDGNKLVLCSGTHLMIYSWQNIGQSISNYHVTEWRIPDLAGNISTAVPLMDNSILCAVELPLGTLCKIQDTFSVPEIVEQGPSISDDIITPRKSQTITDTLFNLPRNPQSNVESSSQLLTVNLQYSAHPTIISRARIPQLLTPDLLVFMPNIGSVVVGSNTQSVLQVFMFRNGDVNSDLLKSSEIKLDKEERPNGITCCPSNQEGILVSFSKVTSTDSAFLTSSSKATDIRLQFCQIKTDCQSKRMDSIDKKDNSLVNKTYERDSLQFSHRETSVSKVNSNHEQCLIQDYTTTSHETREPNQTSKTKDEEHLPIIIGNIIVPEKKLLIQDMSHSSEVKGHDLETEYTDFADKSATFHNDLDKLVHDGAAGFCTPFHCNDSEKEKCSLETAVCADSLYSLNEMARSNDFAGNLNDHEGRTRSNECAGNFKDSVVSASMSTSISSNNMKQMQEEIEKLSKRIEELQQNVIDLKRTQQSADAHNYQTMDNPDLVKVKCSSDDGRPITKSFLLDNGRLMYETVMKTFDLLLLELYIADRYCVVSGNSEGYIPIKFVPGSLVKVKGRHEKAAGKIKE